MRRHRGAEAGGVGRRAWRMSPATMLVCFGAVFFWWVWTQSSSPLMNRLKGVRAKRERFAALGTRVDLTVVAGGRGASADDLMMLAQDAMDRAWSESGGGALGRARAMDRAMVGVVEQGGRGALLRAGGDAIAFGRRADGASWRVGLAHPSRPSEVVAGLTFSLESLAAVAHAAGGGGGIRSMVVFAPGAESGRALADRLAGLTPAEAVAAAGSLPWARVLIIDDAFRVHVSSGLPAKLNEMVLKDAPSSATLWVR